MQNENPRKSEKTNPQNAHWLGPLCGSYARPGQDLGGVQQAGNHARSTSQVSSSRGVWVFSVVKAGLNIVMSDKTTFNN